MKGVIQLLFIVSAILILSTALGESNVNHIFLHEKMLQRYNDRVFVRVYQSVYGADEFASETNYPPSKSIRKDIYQDKAGRIIIYPGKDLDTPTWVGIGDYRNQLKFIKNYERATVPATEPLVRSFLVDYEVIRKILSGNPFPDGAPKGVTSNVDREYANQFGLNRLHTDELRKNAIPDTLVTYTKNPPEPGVQSKKHWGKIHPMSDLEKSEDKIPRRKDKEIRLKKMKDLDWNIIPKIEDQDFLEKVQKSSEFKRKFERTKAFTKSTMISFSEKLKDVVSEEGKFNKLKEFSKPGKIDKILENVEDKQFPRKIHGGFLEELGDFKNKDMNELLKEFTEKLSEKLPPQEQSEFKNQMGNSFEEILPKKYHSEVIVQLGNSEEAKKAASYLFERYKREGKTVSMYREDNVKMYKSFGQSESYKNNIFPNKETRLSIVGHGSHENSKLFIGEKDATQLANHVSKIFFPEDSNRKVLLGKVSLVACNSGNQDELGMGSNFGKKFIETLEKENIETVVSVRVGKLEVTSEGQKLYGTVSEQSFRKSSPIFYRNSERNGLQYGIINKKTSTIDWQSEIPSNIKDTKVLIASEKTGTYDISNIVEKTLTKITSYSQTGQTKSGTLNVQKNIENIGSQIHELRSDIDEPESNKKVGDDVGVISALTEAEASETVDKLIKSMSEIETSLPKGEWIPLIDTAEVQTNGQTKLTVVDIDTHETKTVLVTGDAFLQYKKRSRLHAMSVYNLPTLSRTSIGMSGTGSILGIGGFVMAAIQLSKFKKCEKDITCQSTEAGKVAKVLEINAYIGFSMSTFGVVGDSIQIAELAVSFKLSKNAINGIATMTKTTSNFLKFSKVFGAVGMGVGGVGSVVSLGFSIYELAHAQTKAQKIEFGIQVGIDAINIVVGGVTIGATIAAATTSSALAASLASSAGPVGMVVAVVGILVSTITSLVSEFKNTRKNAGSVGEYFYKLDQVYSKYGIEFEEDSKTLRILQHAIVDTINLETGEIKLDSQYIYRTKSGWSGSGKINYFFFLDHFPKIVWDKSQAINIRSGIGYEGVKTFINTGKVQTLILPSIPKSYISYSYGRLPFCTAMHDKGFDILRRLERDKRFDYDFYIVPGEQIVSRISQEYVSTYTKIYLTKNVKTIFVPDISGEKLNIWHNKYTFHLKTKSAYHTVILNDYYKFIFERTSNVPCTWYLQLQNSDVNEDDIKFQHPRGTVLIKNVKIQLMQLSDKIVLMDQSGGTLRIDPSKSKVELRFVRQPEKVDVDDLKKYLDGMDRNWMAGQSYVTISNFRDNKGVYIGKAYYHVHDRIFLYTNLDGVMVSKEFKDKVKLLGRNQNVSYFMSVDEDTTRIWSTDTKTKNVIASYMLYCGNTDFEIAKMSEQNGIEYLMQKISNVTLVYQFYPKGIRLIFIDGRIDGIKKLGETCFPALNSLSFLYLSNLLPFPGECSYATTVPVLPIKETLHNGKNRRFWLYMNETDNQVSEKKGTFCAEKLKPPVTTGIITPHIEENCTDLSLRHIDQLKSGEKVYFFYCEGDKEKLFYQIENNSSMNAFVPGGIYRIEDFGTGTKLIRTLNGRLYKFTATKNFTLAALDFAVIASNLNWKDMYRNASSEELVETFIPVIHIKDQNNRSLTAWYYPPDDRLIIVSPDITNSNDIVYLGPSPSEVLVWLYSPKYEQLYLQKVLTDEQISKLVINATDVEEPRMKVDLSLAARVAASNINSIQYQHGRVMIVTKEGITISIDYMNTTRLLGVNATWVSKNNNIIKFKLQKLCQMYNSSDPITTGKKILGNRNASDWYHCALHTRIAIPADDDDQLTYLGVRASSKQVYYFVGKHLVEINVSKPEETADRITSKIEVKNVMVRGNTLLVQTTSHSKLSTVPLLDHINTLVIISTQNSLVTIDELVWSHYNTIIISSIGTSGPQSMTVKVRPSSDCILNYDTDGNNTIIKDPLSTKLIVLEDYTMHYGKIDYRYEPVGNEAVVMVSTCNNSPMLLVSNRPRFNGSSSSGIVAVQSFNTYVWIFIVLGIYLVY